MLKVVDCCWFIFKVTTFEVVEFTVTYEVRHPNVAVRFAISACPIFVTSITKSNVSPASKTPFPDTPSSIVKVVWSNTGAFKSTFTVAFQVFPKLSVIVNVKVAICWSGTKEAIWKLKGVGIETICEVIIIGIFTLVLINVT